MKRNSPAGGSDNGSDNDNDESNNRAAQRFKTSGEDEGNSPPPAAAAVPAAAAAAALWAATDALVEETEKAAAQQPPKHQGDNNNRTEDSSVNDEETTATEKASQREIIGQAADMYLEAVAKSSTGRAPHKTFENICKAFGEPEWLTRSVVNSECVRRRKQQSQEEAFINGNNIASKKVLWNNKKNDNLTSAHSSSGREIIRQAADMYSEAVANSSTGRAPRKTFENICKALGDPEWLTRSMISTECNRRRKKEESDEQAAFATGIASKLFKSSNSTSAGATSSSRAAITLNNNNKKTWTEQEEEVKQAARHEATMLAADMYLEAVANSSNGRAPHKTFEMIHQELGYPAWMTRGTIHNEVRRRKSKNTTSTTTATHTNSATSASASIDQDLDEDSNNHTLATQNANANSNNVSRTEQEKQLKREEARLRRQQEQLKAKEERLLRYDLAVAHRLTAKHHMAHVLSCCQHISARLGGQAADGGCLITSSGGHQSWSQVSPKDLQHAAITSNVIHAAVYEARSDVRACIHLHSPSATAVSCLEDGFVPLTQDAAYFYNKVAHYSWKDDGNEERNDDGGSDHGSNNDNNDETGETAAAAASSSSSPSQGPAIIQAIQNVPGCNTLLLENHGFCCFGSSVREAWVLAFYFEQCCATQLQVMQAGGGKKYKVPTTKVMEAAAHTCVLTEFAPGACEQWDALCKDFTF